MARTRPRADQPGPTVFVLFGATGDLAKRMVLPAFFTLAKEGLLPDRWLLTDAEHEFGTDYQLVHYLAIPPVAFVETTKARGGHRRLPPARPEGGRTRPVRGVPRPGRRRPEVRHGHSLAFDVAEATIALSTLTDADPLPPYVRPIHDALLADRSLLTRPDGLAPRF
jgi:hypothetical protein